MFNPWNIVEPGLVYFNVVWVNEADYEPIALARHLPPPRLGRSCVMYVEYSLDLAVRSSPLTVAPAISIIPISVQTSHLSDAQGITRTAIRVF